MLMLLRLTTLAAVLLSVQTAQAQSGLPDEGLLNRLGLTMAWWGQSAVDPRRDHVAFLTADEQNVYVQSSTGMITAFQGEVGRRLWTQLLGVPEQQAFAGSTNDEQFLVSIGLQIFGVDKMTGQLRWVLKTKDHPSAAPSADEDYIFIGTSGGSVYGYNLREVQSLYSRGMLPQWTVRAYLWRFQTPGKIVSPPIIGGDKVTFASESGVVYSLTPQHKELRFLLETGGKIHTPLGFSKELVLVADSHSRMLCVNQDNGRVRWTFSAGTVMRQAPHVIGRQVFVVPHREGLTSISTDSGSVQWQQPIATEMIAVSENRVYASDLSGNLLVLQRDNGTILGVLDLKRFSIRVQNDRTDRIVLASPGGTVLGLREIGSDFPVFHLNPERRPILPELAPEDGAAMPSGDAEK